MESQSMPPLHIPGEARALIAELGEPRAPQNYAQRSAWVRRGSRAAARVTGGIHRGA
jgi:hypothetical protein